MAPNMPEDIDRISCWAEVPEARWNDWHWQMQNAVKDPHALNRILATFSSRQVEISPTVEAISRQHFAFKVTPHMLDVLRRALLRGHAGAWEAFYAGFVPTDAEYLRTQPDAQGVDAIGEELSPVNPVPAVTNFFKNRVLLRVTSMCPAYCRYCFRRRMVGDGLRAWDKDEVWRGIDYIRSNPAIHEVILSGGDPMVLSDEKLHRVLTELGSIEHVRRLRIDTRGLTMMPQRVTPAFVRMLAQHKPLYVMGHFTHAYELAEETKAACAAVVDSGVPLFAHVPLLKGVNDHQAVLAELMEELVNCRVKPYYLIQFIPTAWTEHFRVDIELGVLLMQSLHEQVGGMMMPEYIVYLPDGRGKVPVSPTYLIGRDDSGYRFRSLDGREVLYPAPMVVDAS